MSYDSDTKDSLSDGSQSKGSVQVRVSEEIEARPGGHRIRADDEKAMDKRGRDSDEAEAEVYGEADPDRDDEEAVVASVRLSRHPSAVSELGPPPDGGLTAWSTCVAAHFVFICTWGFVNTFGVYQAYYADFLAPLPPSTISWIGAVQTFLSFFLSAFSGRISDAGHFHLVYWTGYVFMGVGVFATSWGTQYWQLMLSQGLCVGIATGLLCCPTMSVAAMYFSRRRGLALGILTCGNVLGGLIFPAMARQLLPSIGFAWTLRVFGFMELGLLGISGLVIRSRIRAKPGSLAAIFSSSEPLLDFRALLEPQYSLYIVAMMFIMSGTFVIFYYIPSFGRTDITPVFSYPDSLNLLMLMNGTGILGRLSAASLADHVGAINMICPTALTCAIFAATWAAVRTSTAVYVWVAVYGIFGGAIQSLFPTCLTSLTTDPRKSGQRLGLGFTFVGISTLFGPPSAGAMVTRMHNNFLGAQLFAMGLHILGFSILVVVKMVRMRQTGGRWRDKV